MRKVEVAIIGGGPAGMSAALWCSDLGLDTVLIERSAELGGQVASIYNPISNYLGISAANGTELLAHFLNSIRDSKFDRLQSAEVASIDPSTMSIRLADGSSIVSKAIVLATGVRRRRLGIPGEDEFRGSGLIESGARDRSTVKGKKVLIVGGGDAALENALMLSEFASEVLVAFRKGEPTARREFVESAYERKNVTLLNETVLTRISGNSKLESVELRSVTHDRLSSQAVDAVLIRIGVEPNSELLHGKAEVDERGYVVVSTASETSVPNLFAIGDVANRLAPTLNTATGTGATVAKTIHCSISSCGRIIAG
ncbi:MAG TPA: NAD(P)/FAD-dependent oxidoreductase [Pyrinomonadaceae bacterium]|nr:NAD(P)/FAD-dependent oxidoreductase [Pyrinomonadaceae bacterium]